MLNEMMKPVQRDRKALLIVMSAPSGAGKTTLCDRLIADRDDVLYSVSCTTRAPRGDEKNGQDYHFLTPEEFALRIDRREFLEYAEVHGYMYGTLRQGVMDALSAGMSIVMDIDVQGAEQVRRSVQNAAEGSALKSCFIDIFVAPPSLDELRARLVRRKEDSPEVIEKRLRNAEGEMARASEYAHVIVNDELDKAYRQLLEILDREAASHE